MTEPERKRTHLAEPMTLKGFRDYLPEEMIPRNRVIAKIQEVYERYGFLPIDTPILEYLTTLVGTGGEETNKELFRLESPEREPIAMRFDLTVPFARVIAQYPEKIRMPFRRYHIGPVFRADKPGPGRFRQFTQFDIDAAGSESVAVDAEIVAAMCEVLSGLGLRNGGTDVEYQVRINDRKVMDALLEGCGISEVQTVKAVLRVVDKLQKVGIENVRKELGEGRVDESGDPIRGLGLERGPIDRVLEFLSIQGGTRREIVARVARLLPPQSVTSQTALGELNALADALDALGVGESEAVFDPSLARGLDYYTGPVFEAFLPAATAFGSIMGGGRYDGLVERFLDEGIPATGASIGLDRLMAALLALGKVETTPTVTQVLVVSMTGVPVSELLRLAGEIRAGGIPTEVYMGSGKTSVRDQLSHANLYNIPVAVILGPDEINQGTVSIKNLVEGQRRRSGIEAHEDYVKAGKAGQVTIPRTEMVNRIREMIAE